MECTRHRKSKYCRMTNLCKLHVCKPLKCTCPDKGLEIDPYLIEQAEEIAQTAIIAGVDGAWTPRIRAEFQMR